MRRTPLVAAFATWTLLVWGGRISNIWRDQDLDTTAQLGRTALAGSFVAGAVAVVAAGCRGPGDRLVRVTGVVAAWTAAVWLVRGTAIVAGDWSAGFKIVHTALAAASVALAALATRQARDRARPSARPIDRPHEHGDERPVPG